MEMTIDDTNERFRGEMTVDSDKERDAYLALIWGYGHAGTAIPLGDGKWRVISSSAEE